MKTEISLKTKNIPQTLIFITWCICLYVVFLEGYDDFWSKFSSLYSDLSAKDGLLASLSPLILFVLSGILSPQIKAVIVFWKIRYALPGHRAFSHHGPNDSRVDMEALQEIVGALPEKPLEQNKAWYKIYKTQANKITVKTAHKNFLLARDLTCVAMFSMFLLPLALFITDPNNGKILLLSGILFIQYLVLSVVAQSYGKTFVRNVLAEASI